MKLLTAISTAFFATLTMSSAYAGSFFTVDTNLVESDFLYSRPRFEASSEAMMDQILNKGCLPRGELLLRDSGTGSMESKGVLRPRTHLVYKFQVCNDPLLSYMPLNLSVFPPSYTGNARSAINLNIRVFQFEKDNFSRANIPKVSLITPSGRSVPLNTVCYNSPYKRCHSLGFNNEPLVEVGEYQIRIDNPGSSRVNFVVYGAGATAFQVRN